MRTASLICVIVRPAVTETTALTKRTGRPETVGATPAWGEDGCNHPLLSVKLPCNMYGSCATCNVSDVSVVNRLVNSQETVDAANRIPANVATDTDTATLLEDAADRIADISRADLQVMLRRAALRLRNAGAVSMEDDVEDALRNLAGELGMTRNDTIRFIVGEWMEKNTYLPVHALDEDGDVDGTA